MQAAVIRSGVSFLRQVNLARTSVPRVRHPDSINLIMVDSFGKRSIEVLSSLKRTGRSIRG